MEIKPIPAQIVAQVQEHFDNIIPRNLFLVKKGTLPDRVYRVQGSISIKGNVTVSFFISEDEGYYTEYFVKTDDFSAHRRWVVGQDDFEQLENYEGQYDLLDDDISYDEHKRIIKHNKEVRDLLIKKGFVKK